MHFILKVCKSENNQDERKFCKKVLPHATRALPAAQCEAGVTPGVTEHTEHPQQAPCSTTPQVSLQPPPHLAGARAHKQPWAMDQPCREMQHCCPRDSHGTTTAPKAASLSWTEHLEGCPASARYLTSNIKMLFTTV